MIRNRNLKYVHRFSPVVPTSFTTWRTTRLKRATYLDGGTDNAASATCAASLLAELETWYGRYVDPRMDCAKNNVTGRGQIGLAGSEDYAKPFADDVIFFHEQEG